MKIKCKNSYAEELLFGFIFYWITVQGSLNPGFMLSMIKGFDTDLFDIVENDFKDYTNVWTAENADEIKVQNSDEGYFIKLPAL